VAPRDRGPRRSGLHEAARAAVRGRRQTVAPVAVGTERTSASPAAGWGGGRPDRGGAARARASAPKGARLQRGRFRETPAARDRSGCRGTERSAGGWSSGRVLVHRSERGVPPFLCLGPTGGSCRWRVGFIYDRPTPPARVRGPSLPHRLPPSRHPSAESGGRDRDETFERGDPGGSGLCGPRALPEPVYRPPHRPLRGRAVLLGDVVPIDPAQSAEPSLLPHAETVLARHRGRLPLRARPLRGDLLVIRPPPRAGLPAIVGRPGARRTVRPRPFARGRDGPWRRSRPEPRSGSGRARESRGRPRA
jgi:hypothetical protein